MWAGPLTNWIAACDLMLGMDVEVVVPGHGPVTDKSGVVAVRDYLELVEREAADRQAAGVDAWEAAREIAALLGVARRSSHPGPRPGALPSNVETVYRSHDPQHQSPDIVEQFRRMAALERGT